jgi:Leucine-rich repeat (LRR) protein
VSAALLKSRSIKTLNLANNRIADMTEIGLGLYLNGSLEQLNVSENLIADDTFFWFSVWGKQKEHLSHTRLQNFDLRGNKLGDMAAAHMFMGLRRRKYNRTLTRMDVSDNLIDPLLTEAVMTFLDIKRSFKYNKMQAEKLVKQKRQNDKK